MPRPILDFGESGLGGKPGEHSMPPHTADRCLARSMPDLEADCGPKRVRDAEP